MRLIHTISEMKALVRQIKKENKTIGLVPSMGSLHEGHLTLMRTAKQQADFVVASVFVNPIQFGVGEDYETYPRNVSKDAVVAGEAGVDAIFAPSVEEMYPGGFATFVAVEGLTDKLCGKSRPGHFRGVTTVVNKLFNIIEPNLAFFGQKDAQQVLVIKRMVADLNLNLKIEVVPIVREADGLALSSRNTYLSPAERKAALVLSRSLKLAKQMTDSGERNVEKIKNEIIKFINKEPLAKIDYVEILSVPELEERELINGKTLIALAVYIGKTRLIDNIIVEE